VPFLQAGEELLRSKPLPEGGFDHNSYRSPDSINSIKWDTLSDPLYQEVSEYYAGLIAFRKAHPALSMTSAEEVAAHISMLSDLDFNVVACHITAGANGEENEIIAIFNPRSEATTVTLPEGEWIIYVNSEKAGVEPLGNASGSVAADAVSAMVLVKVPQTAPETVPQDTVVIGEGEENSVGIIGGADGPTAIFVTTTPGGIVALIILIAAIIGGVVLIIKKRKK